MAVAYNPGIVTDGLVLCLDAANRKSYPGTGTGWNDLSTIGNNGTLLNGVTFSNQNNGSMVFDGTDDNVAIINSISSLSNFTIELFMLTSLLDFSQDIFFDQHISLRFEIVSNVYRIHLGNGVGWAFTDHSGNTTLLANQWYQTVWSWNGSSSILYLNGNQDSVKNYSAASSGSGNIVLGKYSQGGGYDWNGRIANVKIYNRALSAQEISQNFNALRGRFGI